MISAALTILFDRLQAIRNDDLTCRLPAKHCLFRSYLT